MSRTIIVASPSANKAKRITDFQGSTWGQLKQHPTVAELVVGDVEAILNPGDVTLRGDNSTLPEGDFRVYLIAKKNKAGAMTESDARTLGQEIAEAITKAAAKGSLVEKEELKKDLIDVVNEFFGVEDDVEDDCPECEEALAEARNLR